MTTSIITTRPDLDNYEQRVDLDGVEYRLGIAWNRRGEHWTMSLSLADGSPVVSGIRIVADTPLLAAVSHPDRPLGELVALDTSGASLDPGRDDLGQRVLLMHQSLTE